jgi:NADPH2:quinone reductase
MRAVRIHGRGGLDVVRLDEVPNPVPGAGEVLIRVAVAGINRADLCQRAGSSASLRPLPTTLGSEVAGHVVALGPGVEGVAIGSRVTATVDGGYAELAVARATELIPVPDGVPLAKAVAITIQGITAYLLLTVVGRLQPGEAVLVHAAGGGVGSLAVQVARILGAGRVIATDVTDAKLALALDLGADLALDPRDPAWRLKVHAATGGHGVDVALDPIGGPASQQTLGCLARHGRLVTYGTLSGLTLLLAAQQLIPLGQSVMGFSLDTQPHDRVLAAAGWLFDRILDGSLRIPISHTFPLDQAAVAQHTVEAGHSLGKVILAVEPAGPRPPGGRSTRRDRLRTPTGTVPTAIGTNASVVGR